MAWMALERKYKPKDGQSKIKLKRELAQSKLESGEDPEEWITQLLQKTARLVQLGGSFTEEDMMLHILCNLPEEFENTVENNEKALNDGTLTLEDLRSFLDSKFKRLSTGKQFKTLLCIWENIKRTDGLTGNAAIVVKQDTLQTTVGHSRRINTS